MEENTTTRKNTKKKTPYRMYLLALLGLVIVAGGAYFGWMKYQAMQNTPEAQAVKAEDEKKKILASLTKLMVLPEGDPVLFKVSDAEVMKKQQAFFKDTQNGDVLLVFQTSGKAIIYRPSTNVIVNVGPVNFDQTKTDTTNKTPTPAPVTGTSTDTKTKTK